MTKLHLVLDWHDPWRIQRYLGRLQQKGLKFGDLLPCVGEVGLEFAWDYAAGGLGWLVGEGRYAFGDRGVDYEWGNVRVEMRMVTADGLELGEWADWR